MVNSPQCRSVVRNNYWYSKNHLWSHFERRRRGKRSVVARSVDGKKKIAINFNSGAVRWVCPDGGSSALQNRTGDEVKRGRRKIFNRGFRFHLTEPELRSHIRCKFSHQVRFFSIMWADCSQVNLSVNDVTAVERSSFNSFRLLN